jgi:exonuclease VII small subunit
MTSDKKSIQDKVSELDKLVEWFQGDDFQLEDAKATLKKAADLAQDIESDLKSIANEITEVKKSFQSETEA